METQDYAILEERLPEAVQALDKLVKKAKRYGCSDIYYSVGERFVETVRVHREDGTVAKYDIPKVWVGVGGEAPVVGDYRFLAHIELTEQGNLVDTLPGVKHLDARFQHSTGFCEHCQTNRRRKDVYALEHAETGEQVQIGRTCLRDFLGTDTPEKIAHRFTRFQEFAEALGEYNKPGWVAGLVDVLELTAAAIRQWGWCSRGMAYGYPGATSTEQYVRLGLASPAGLGREERRVRQQLLDEVRESDKELAQAVIDWVRASTGESEYWHNLRVLFSGDALLDPRRVAIAASAVASHQREQAKEREQQVERQSEHQGEVKQRLRGLEVTLQTSIFLGSNQFGDRYLVKFLDAAGNLYIWFTRCAPQEDDGASLVIDGTVKGHDEFKGVKQTILTRVKVH